jgi:hypothetical protein
MVPTEYNLGRLYQNTSCSATVVAHLSSRTRRATCATQAPIRMTLATDRHRRGLSRRGAHHRLECSQAAVPSARGRASSYDQRRALTAHARWRQSRIPGTAAALGAANKAAMNNRSGLDSGGLGNNIPRVTADELPSRTPVGTALRRPLEPKAPFPWTSAVVLMDQQTRAQATSLGGRSSGPLSGSALATDCVRQLKVLRGFQFCGGGAE